MTHKTDYYGNPVTLPQIGDKVLCDGYQFTVTEILNHEDVCIVASISLRGEGGEIGVGYYDYLLHQKA